MEYTPLSSYINFNFDLINKNTDIMFSCDENSDNSRDSDYYNNEINEIDKMFPMNTDAHFTISIPLNKMDKLITTSKMIIIKQTFDCYCYGNMNLCPKLFIICGEKITNKYILQKLIEYNLKLDCNHVFIEGFVKKNGFPNVYEIFTGS